MLFFTYIANPPDGLPSFLRLVSIYSAFECRINVYPFILWVSVNCFVLSVCFMCSCIKIICGWYNSISIIIADVGLLSFCWNAPPIFFDIILRFVVIISVSNVCFVLVHCSLCSIL